MTRVDFGNTLPEERSVLNVEVIGKTSNWLAMLALTPGSKLNMQLVDWSLFPLDSNVALTALRTSIVIALTNHLENLKRVAHSSGVDTCTDKDETPEGATHQPDR